MDDLINTIKNDENIKQNVAKEIIKFRNSNYITKEKIGEINLHQARVFEEALKVAGDEIYELDTENNVLKEQIGDKLDEELIKEQMKHKMLKDNNEDKNKKILARLTRRYKQMKSIK